MSALLKELQAKTKEINDIKANLVKELQPKFKDIFMPLFDKYDHIQGFRWQQYTPYFNDGEECLFRVGDIGVQSTRLDGDYEADDEDQPKWTDGTPSEWIFTSDKATTDKWYMDRQAEILALWGDTRESYLAFLADLAELNKAVAGIPEDVMQDLFGNHVQITVTREGIEVGEYDHD